MVHPEHGATIKEDETFPKYCGFDSCLELAFL